MIKIEKIVSSEKFTYMDLMIMTYKCNICGKEIEMKEFHKREINFHSRKTPSGKKKKLYSHKSCYEKELKRICFRTKENK